MTRPQVSILVPTLGREEFLPALLATIIESTEVAWELVFVLDCGDVPSWKAVTHLAGEAPDGAVVVVAKNGTYPAKTNAGYRASCAPFVLPTADDVVFKSGWDAALEEFHDPEVCVVGTNDLSPNSHAGHATMPILRRTYVDEPGASFGEPGKVFFEGYRHNYVETEICELARHREVWSYCEAAVIEHLHPSWGKREVDDTDAVGNLNGMSGDEELFWERCAVWTSRS